MALTLDHATYRPGEVAALLGLHLDTIRRDLHTGRLTAIGTGTHRRISREAILFLLNEPPPTRPVGLRSLHAASGLIGVAGAAPKQVTRLDEKAK